MSLKYQWGQVGGRGGGWESICQESTATRVQIPSTPVKVHWVWWPAYSPSTQEDTGESLGQASYLDYTNQQFQVQLKTLL